MTWKAWICSLGAAIISGAAATGGSVLGAMAAGYDVMDEGFWKIIAGGVVGGALVSALAFLKQSPLPATLLTTTVTQTDSVKKIPGGATTTTATTKTETTERPEPPPTGPAPGTLRPQDRPAGPE